VTATVDMRPSSSARSDAAGPNESGVGQVSLPSPCRAARSGLKIGAGRPLTSFVLDPFEVGS
jgi:hypothetical protein